MHPRLFNELKNSPNYNPETHIYTCPNGVKILLIDKDYKPLSKKSAIWFDEYFDFPDMNIVSGYTKVGDGFLLKPPSE